MNCKINYLSHGIIKGKRIRLIPVFLFTLVTAMFLSLGSQGLKASYAGYSKFSTTEDTSRFISIKGKVIDFSTRKAIAYTNIYVEGTNIGTISNSEGEFLLKIPKKEAGSSIKFSYMGYKSQNLTIEQLKYQNYLVELSIEVITLNELVIRSNDPINLIRSVLHNIPDNYGKAAYYCTAFYRESVMMNKQYVGLAEAVLKIYKSNYANEFDADRVKVFKGRKSQDVKKMDTIMFKLQGGHQAVVLLDLAKNPETFMSEEYFNNYEFKPVTITNIEGRQTYVIEFTQKPGLDEPYYDGRLFIDVNTMAIHRAEFNISPVGIKYADKYLVKKKPLGTDVKTLSANYLVNYREQDGKWILNHAHYEVKFRVIKKGKLFNKIYTSAADLAITDIDTWNVEKFKMNESLKANQVFVDKVDEYYDEEFWGSYNIIKPEESLEDAVERISKRIRKMSDL